MRGTPSEIRSLITSSGSCRISYDEHGPPFDGRGDPALTAHVARVLAELHVETPIHLEHQHPPVAEAPLAVSEPNPPVGVAAPTLPAGSADPELGAGTVDVDLGEGLCPATDVREQATELLGTPERPESLHPVAEPLRVGESLLNDRRDCAVGGAPVGLIAREQKDRRLDHAEG